MGFKQSELVPLQSASPTIPAAKTVMCKAFQVARTDTTASVKCRLPANSSILDFKVSGIASNAGTTATVNLGVTSTSTEFVNGLDVKGGSSALARPTIDSTYVNVAESLPVGQDISIYAKYAETGTASSAGGPWTVVVLYV